MTLPGQRIAKPPISPHQNLAAVERIGSTRHGSAIWRLDCACGYTLQADVPTIKRGAARCPDCNPNYGDLEAQRILAVLPATIDQIVERTSMTLQQVRYRLPLMKPHLCHVGKWRHSRGSGAYQPVIVAGHGEDAPCTLKRRSGAEGNKRYRDRVRKAVEKALAGGTEDVRYTRYIGVARAGITAAQTRIAPQTWFSALM